ncbi:MAG: hypothetical protein EAZ55_11120 [Cytophagales bacterium]|nr:MAG: hypothetical protein EAZ55_11120 [Cytophagales bacterium]
MGLFSELSAQVILQLGNGKITRLEAKLVYEDKLLNKEVYLRETPDTLYFYEYYSILQTLDEVCVPLRFFDKQNTKKYKSEVYLINNQGDFIVKFNACAPSLVLSAGNRFLRSYYGYKQSVAMNNRDVSLGIYFTYKDEAKLFYKRIKNNIKSFN